MMRSNARYPAAILFDMDDTILDDTGATQRCWEMACAHYASQAGSVTPTVLHRAIDEYRRWYWSDPERHRTGRLNLAQARRDIVATAFQRLGLDAPDIAGQLADFHTSQRDLAITPFPGALETLQQLQSDGMRLALLTNGNAETQRQKIVRFGLACYFDCILIEGEFGTGKPDARVYRHAMDQLKTTPSETWMVGDNLEWDIAAPQRLGIFGIWNDLAGNGLPAATSVRPDRIINTITELI